MKNKPLSDNNGEVRELTADDTTLFRPTAEVLPQELLSALPKRGRPPKKNPKQPTTIRLDPEVLKFFKAQGKGWQTQVNAVLHEYVDSQHTT